MIRRIAAPAAALGAIAAAQPTTAFAGTGLAFAQQPTIVPLPQRPDQPAPAPVPPASRDVPAPVAPGEDAIAADAVPVDINPYDRDLDLTVPLLYRNDTLGDLPIRLTRHDRVLVDSAAFLRIVAPRLSESAVKTVTGRLAQGSQFVPGDLADLGIELKYDPSSLALVLEEVAPEIRQVETLFGPPFADTEVADIAPAPFSGYLNLNVAQSYLWEEESPAPTIALNGAIRAGGLVLEGDGQFGEGFGFTDRGYRFDRNYLRLVHDQPHLFRRWMLGDLTPETRGQQGYVRIGGLAVVRQRRVFNAYRTSVLQSDRRLLLTGNSSVRILRNGVPFRELQLEAGNYDLSTLPLLAGSNDIQIEVRDASGFVQSIAYESYLDPIDLAPGDFEYAAYLGPTSRTFSLTPDYSGPVAFSGFFRKAFLDMPAIGVGLQLSEDVQTVTGQTQFVLGNGGRILVDAGASHTRFGGAGFATALSYDQFFDRDGLIDSFTIRGDFRSRRYANLGNELGLNPNAFSLDAQYTRSINRRLTALISGNFSSSRADDRNRYRISAGANYLVNARWSLRGSIDYVHSPGGGLLNGGSGLGANISLVYRPSYRSRAELRHDTRFETTSIAYARSSPNEINSIGYGGIATYAPDGSSLQAYADFIGNRFDASLSHSSFGEDIGRIGDSNLTTLRIGTSFAFAGGALGIGRRIADSFAILQPHENLGNRRVVAGQSISDNRYTSMSGALGGAVQNTLTSYVAQSVQYDVENPPAGYDVGQGVVRVRPPYRSGYSIRVGTDAFVSAFGNLLMADGAPVPLTGGVVTPLDGENRTSVPFFTNSAGRFAISNLRPGMRYRVVLNGGARSFEFAVPEDSTGLLNLDAVRLPQD